MFLEKFILPTAQQEENVIHGAYNNPFIENAYPFGVFAEKQLTELDFTNITIIYGGNGSGKSTLLNLISQTLHLKRDAPFNNSELFDLYVKQCKYRMSFNDFGEVQNLPDGSSYICSDDVFEYMLSVRDNNEFVENKKHEVSQDWLEKRYGESIRFNSMEDYEDVKTQLLARRKSVSLKKYLNKAVENKIKLKSNGETALKFFKTKLKDDTLYCLDEPENSLSPKLQMELAQDIQNLAKYCGCQFIIATHSPFLLAINNAKIYDLDSNPVEIKKWWELENCRIYFEFFEQNKRYFQS